MKAVVINNFVDSYDDVKVSEVPRPVPNDDEVLIQVHAAGVNFVDTLYARGKHQNNLRHMKPPFTLGLEFSGTMISVPKSLTTTFSPGDRVLGDFSGAYAEYILYPASSLASSSLHRVPDSWSFADAAGLAATLPVSYGALDSAGGLKPGQTVLVHAAAGGLGLAAVQIASALGCTVIGTAGSAEKCRVAESFGARKCVDYTANPKWWEEVLALTRGAGVDVVFDSVGLVDQSLKCVAHRGKVLVVGFAGREGNMEGVKMNKVLLKQVSIIGYRYGESLRRYPEEKAKIWSQLWPLINSGKIRPAVYTDREYRGLASVPQALKDIASRRVWGKAVIQVHPNSDAAFVAASNGDRRGRSDSGHDPEREKGQKAKL
ncbi:zeta-crystallin [Microdochium trichocladiopsis]|uniref:Zeta-crystallin n=1 Tax=Microdochium trichocladiopsis TaxID=1682393 RepID=A0A9P9BJV7_9PEZI|nr:zeta-crystallin [Microdochium trichocladiopsis]KAH7018543.1 zeta-crystallin [Microdochium trichocladiopsis]